MYPNGVPRRLPTPHTGGRWYGPPQCCPECPASLPRSASQVSEIPPRTHYYARSSVRPYPGTALTCERASVTFGTWGSPRNAHEAHAYMHAWNRSFMGSVLVVETLKSSILSLTKKTVLIVVRCATPPPLALTVATPALFYLKKRTYAQTSYPSSFLYLELKTFRKN